MTLEKRLASSIHALIACVQWGLYFLTNALFLVLLPYIKKKFFKSGWNQLHKDFSRFGKVGMGLFGIDGHLTNPHGVDLSKQYIIAANHRSWFDQIALMGLYPKNVHFLAKAEYFDVPFFKYCLNNYECIPVHKKHLTNQTSSQLGSYLKRGDDVVFFVEGTRGSGRHLLPFRKGAFHQSAQTGIPVLPTYILGSEQCLSKKNSLLSVQQGDIIVVVGKPVHFSAQNLEQQIKEFENHYRQVHDTLYVNYTKYQLFKGPKRLQSLLDFSRV